MHPPIKSNGEHYDILVLSEKPSSTMNIIAKSYSLKERSVDKPAIYLEEIIK